MAGSAVAPPLSPTPPGSRSDTHSVPAVHSPGCCCLVPSGRPRHSVTKVAADQSPPPPPAVPQLTPVGVDWPEQAERRAPASQPHVERPCSAGVDQETRRRERYMYNREWCPSLSYTKPTQTHSQLSIPALPVAKIKGNNLLPSCPCPSTRNSSDRVA